MITLLRPRFPSPPRLKSNPTRPVPLTSPAPLCHVCTAFGSLSSRH